MESCAENVVRRSSVGQKAVLIRLRAGSSYAENVKKIEIKRQECDFLVIAFNCKGCTGDQEDAFLNDSDLRCYAALSAVDAIVDLKGLSKEMVTQFFNNLAFTIL